MFTSLIRRRKMLRRTITILPVFLLSACLSLPIGGGGSSGLSVDPGSTVQVALLVPKGSPSPDVQKLARDLENAARLAIADTQGASIALRVYDTGGQTGQAAQVAAQAVNEGAKIIIGPLYAEGSNAAAVAVQPANVNVMSFSNNPTIAGGNLFILGPTFSNTADTLMGYATKLGKRRIVTVYSDNVAGELGRDAIIAAVSRSGATNVATIGYAFSEAGVVSAVPRIKSAIDQTQADAIFLTANSAGALPILADKLPAAGVTPGAIQYIGLSRWDSPAQTLSLPGVQGGWFAMPDPARSGAYNSRFKAAYGYSPHAVSSLAYDGIAAIGALLKKGRRDALQTSGLTQSAGFQGATGVFRFNSEGTNERALAVAGVRGKQVFILQPAPTEFGRSLF